MKKDISFSIIVPVYNVYDYLDRCLSSIKNQTYLNMEVIIVNDGSRDNSQEIIDKYVEMDKRFKSYIKENGGLSDARNYGVKYAKGEYLIFVDSDDYIDKDLLMRLSLVLKKKKYEVVRYMAKTVKDDGTVIKDESIREINDLSLENKILEILSNYYVEPVWLYAIKRKFYLKNKFSFPKGMIHEDFGTTLIILSKVRDIYIMNYCGYYYVMRDNSIMSYGDYSKELKKVNDFFLHHLNNRKVLGNSSVDRLLLNYSASCTICKGRGLKEEELDEYVQAIKKYKIIDDIYGNTLKRKLKKIYLRLNLERYIISLRGR